MLGLRVHMKQVPALFVIFYKSQTILLLFFV
jgi:hypothetical protein